MGIPPLDLKYYVLPKLRDEENMAAIPPKVTPVSKLPSIATHSKRECIAAAKNISREFEDNSVLFEQYNKDVNSYLQKRESGDIADELIRQRESVDKIKMSYRIPPPRDPKEFQLTRYFWIVINSITVLLAIFTSYHTMLFWIGILLAFFLMSPVTFKKPVSKRDCEIHEAYLEQRLEIDMVIAAGKEKEIEQMLTTMRAIHDRRAKENPHSIYQTKETESLDNTVSGKIGSQDIT